MATTGRFILIGGIAPTPVAGSDGMQMTLRSDMFEFDSATGAWAVLEQAPAAVAGPSAAYDPLTALVVAFGRGNTAFYDPADRSWQLLDSP